MDESSPAINEDGCLVSGDDNDLSNWHQNRNATPKKKNPPQEPKHLEDIQRDPKMRQESGIPITCNEMTPIGEVDSSRSGFSRLVWSGMKTHKSPKGDAPAQSRPRTLDFLDDVSHK